MTAVGRTRRYRCAALENDLTYGRKSSLSPLQSIAPRAIVDATLIEVMLLMTPVIRAFEPSDVAAFTELLNMPGVVAGTLQQPFRSFAERAKLAEYFCPQVNIVAEADGVLLGHACLNVASDISCRHSGTIDVVVRDDYWRMGIGTKLVRTLLGHVDKWRSQRRIDVMSMKPRKLSAVLS